MHHGDDVRDLVEAHGYELLYLTTYSSDFVLGKTAPPGPARNPIEYSFAKLEALIKALRPDSTDELIQVFSDAVKLDTPEQVLNTFVHCSYGLER